jgi:hypothetical protein
MSAQRAGHPGQEAGPDQSRGADRLRSGPSPALPRVIYEPENNLESAGICDSIRRDSVAGFPQRSGGVWELSYIRYTTQGLSPHFPGEAPLTGAPAFPFR